MDEVSSECVSELITCQCLRPIEMGKPSPGQSKDADSVYRKYGPQLHQLGGWQPETVPLQRAALEQ